nr:response regulator [Caldimonas mangrovi]
MVSALIFAGLAPFAKLQLPRIGPFIPVYQSALVVNDLVTAVLLFGQFHILRRRALLVLAGGYLVTAVMAALHMLSFPGLFSPGGLLGAGPQSTAWIYMFWHAAFPLCVMGYALGWRRESRAARPGLAIAACVAVALVCAGGLAALATAGQQLLPPIMEGNRYTPAMIFVVSSVWVFSVVALALLWRRAPHSVLDLWLMVVMCAWLFDIALAAVLNGGRFDLGFYAGRIYGLLASAFVLGVLLLENGTLYARLAESHERELSKNAELLHLNNRLVGMNAVLGEANTRLQQASRFKSEFLANMSHELRTPLTAIIGFSELLKDGVAGPVLQKQAHFSRQIYDSGHHLLGLLNEVLDLSKVEAGKMSLDLDGVEPDGFLRACLATFEGSTERRGMKLAFEPLPPGTGHGERIAVDPRKLRQLVYNLLSNAIKFAPDGGSVRLVLRHAPPGTPQLHDAQGRPTRVLALRAAVATPRGYLEIRVSDDGAGMSGDDLGLLFEAYRQVRSGDGYGRVGTGLGLALVSRYAELHGGTVGVASAPGRGTTFAVWIPWREAPSAALPPEQVQMPAVAAAGRRRRAVVIEDDPAAAELLKLHLESAGFEVRCIDNPGDLQRMAEPVPDVITLDIMLPGQLGWDVLGRIKSHPVLATVPVVIVSVLSELQRGFALGASSVLQKPVGREALLHAVRDAGLQSPPLRPCKVLVVDDDPAAVDLVATALEGPKCEVLKAYDGPTAVRIASDAELDLIVLDLVMPGMSGFEVVEQVRRQPAKSSVPILVMTAQTISPAEQELLQGRVGRIVGKATFDERRFLSEVRNALHQH